MQKGIAVPHESSIVNGSFEKKLQEDEEFREKEKELKSHADKAKAQYDYKYSSP